MKKFNRFLLFCITFSSFGLFSSTKVWAQNKYNLYITYKLPTNPILVSDASNLESECTNKHAVCMQACQIGDGKVDCQNRCEQAFRQCLLGIKGVKFWLAACKEGSCNTVDDIIPLTREEALDIRLNDKFYEISPGYYRQTGTYVTVSTGSYTFRRTSDNAEISFPGSFLLGQAISNHYDENSPIKYLFKNALYRAIENGQDALMESLLSRGLDPSGLDPNGEYHYYHPIAAAIKKERWDIVKKLVLKYNADVTKSIQYNDNYCLPLELAVYSDDINNVKLFLEHGAAINGREEVSGIFTTYPLQCAVINKNIPMVKFLLSNGADIKNSDYLYTAVIKNDIEMVKYLISQGADVNYYNVETPLTQAAYQGNLAIIKILVQNGANVNKINHFGETALDLAEKKNHTEVATFLRSKGAKNHK